VVTDSYNVNNLFFEYESKNDSKPFRLGPLKFKIPKSKMTFICGRSGSGKSTLLAIMGLLRTEFEGEMILNGQDVNSIKEKRSTLSNYRLKNIGFALQKGRLLPYLSVKENSSFILEYLGLPSEEIDSTCNNLFKKLFDVELKEDKKSYQRVLDSLPEDISGGQYQRAALARALINKPSIILADEPTGNLDVNSGEKAMELLKDYLKEQEDSTVIIVSHDLEYARLYADKIIILKKGQLSASITKVDNKNWSEGDEIISSDQIEKYLNSKIKDDE
jgi:ABC-type lipoprotein export system ATPase subunit